MTDRAGRIAHVYGDLASDRLDDDFNLYAYTYNDPLNGTDPTGEDCEDPSTGPCQEVTVTAEKPKTNSASTIFTPAPVPIPVPGRLPAVRGATAAIALNILIGMLTHGCGDSGTVGDCAKGSNVVKAEQKRSDKSRKSKPTNAPSGTKPIDQSGLGKEKIHDIKDGVGAGPEDYVGITPSGDVITTKPDGTAENHGSKDSY